MQGWITLTNSSGTNYESAQTLLVAGSPSQAAPTAATTPWRPPVRRTSLEQAGTENGSRERLGDFYLYPLPERTTLANLQTKQVGFLDVHGVPAEHGYEFSNHWLGTSEQPQSAKSTYRFSTSAHAGLGDQLPAGILRFYLRDKRGEPQFIGESRIDHTPMGSTLSLVTGDAFDVKVKAIVDKRTRVNEHDWKTDMRYELSNATARAVTVELLQDGLWGDSTISAESQKSTRRSADVAEWNMSVPANGDLAATVTLSYLAHGLDWAADYTATLAADGRSMDLGAWVTLANGNGVSFRDAHAQVVAGRLNRTSGTVDPIDVGGPILANCWPRGSTSDSVPPLLLQRALLREAKNAIAQTDAIAATMPMAAPMAAQIVREEALGDLKLYRIPERTTVAARQSKQVRLLDRAAIPVTVVYGVELGAYASTNGRDGALPASRFLRTRNTDANHLGIALPSGHVQVFAIHQGSRLLESESNLRDLAVDEDVEIDLGQSPDVQVAATRTGPSHRVEISNARASEIEFELKLRLADGARIVGANRKVAIKDGRPIFSLTVPPHTTTVVQYQTAGAP